MKFERSGWTILLNEDEDITAAGRDPQQVRMFDTLVQTGVRNDHPCETFTLMFKDVGVMLAQVNIFEDGSTAAHSFIPTIVQIDATNHMIHIDLLCNFRAVGDKVFVSSIDEGSEFELTAFWLA